MAKNTMPRNIPLEAVCDLSATQRVTDYEGFRGINSFNMNGRLCTWYRKKSDSVALSDTVTAKDNGDKFIIFDNGKEVMQVSKKKYVEEYVGYYPSSAEYVTTTWARIGQDYEWTEWDGVTYHGMWQEGFIFKCEYNGKDAVLVTVKHDKSHYQCFFFQDGVRLGSWESRCRINVISKVNYKDGTALNRNYFPEAPLGIIWTSWPENFLETPESVAFRADETHVLKINSLGQVVPDKDDLTSPFRGGADGDAARAVAIGWNKLLVNTDNNGYWTYHVVYGSCHEPGQHGLCARVNGKKETSVDSGYTVTYSSAECETYKISFQSANITYPYTDDPSCPNAFSKDNFHRIESLKTIHYENYSLRIGEFAMNYVKNERYSIGHDYKKIIQIDEHSDFRYTDDSVYYKNGGKVYRLHVVETDELDYSILDGNIIIFNTTDYKNAYDMAFGNVFCSSDDWNNRAQWCVKTYSDNWRQLNSRLNQNWQTQKKVVGTSDQLDNVTQRLAFKTEGETTVSDPSNMDIFYIDDSYTCPEGVEYDVFFESALTGSIESAGGSLVKQGTISTKGFTVSKDEGMTYSQPGRDQNQMNIPVLGCSFETYSGTTLFKIGDFTHQSLKQSMLGNLTVPVYIFGEVGYSATDYAMFAINGTLYSYYPKTNQITDSDGLFVCDTSTLVYLGYSTKAAYFYCKMDRGVYTFTGANEMQRVFNVETRTPLLAPFKGGSSNERGDTLNLPSLDFVAVNLGDGFAVLFGSQLCVVDTEETIAAGGMRMDKSRGVMQAGGYDWSLIKRDGWDFVPIEFETQFYGDASGESNMVNDAVYFELTNYNGKSEGKITVQTVALVNGTVKEGAKKTISVGKSDFNKAGIARVRYQPDIQECRGFKLKVVSDFEIASMKIGCETGALAQPKVRM